MAKVFWRVVYGLKYWRVLLPGLSAAMASLKPGNSSIVKIVMVLFFLVPFSIGLGFGYLAWTHSKRLENQNAVDSSGIAVTAKVEGTHIEEVRHRSTRMGDGERRTPDPSYFCHMGVSYKAAGSDEVLRKQFKFEDETICKRYKTGAPIQGKLLPSNPNIMVLDEGRLDVFWYWISLALFVLFAVLPMLLVIRRLLTRKK